MELNETFYSDWQEIPIGASTYLYDNPYLIPVVLIGLIAGVVLTWLICSIPGVAIKHLAAAYDFICAPAKLQTLINKRHQARNKLEAKKLEQKAYRIAAVENKDENRGYTRLVKEGKLPQSAIHEAEELDTLESELKKLTT